MNVERLLKLADHLGTVPLERFDMFSWKCGTLACAVGHACSIPEFQNAGLHLHRRSGLNFSTVAPVFGDYDGWGAVHLFFDLNIRDADFLFSENEYPEQARTPAGVADRIREFVVERQSVIKSGEMPLQRPVFIKAAEGAVS